VKVTVSGSCESGFDQNKLKNGLLEPLRETGLISQQGDREWRQSRSYKMV
jgi:hypothetical protein